MIRERKAQYKDHHKPCKFGIAVLKDGLEGADNGVINEHLCPLGNGNIKTPHDVAKIGMKCVIMIDNVLLGKMKF